jgi:drug/metabolite transporter (DMT)-like permease
MDWFLLSMMGVVAIAVSNLLQRTLMKDEQSNVFAYSLVFQLACGALVGLFALARGFVMPPIQDLLPSFVIITVLYAAGTLFRFKALQKTGVGEVTILSSSRALWTIAVALLFLGESFSLLKFAGVVLVLGGLALVQMKKEAFKLNEGSLYALAAALCYGVAFANDTYILRQSDAISYAAVAFLLPGLLIFAINPGVSRKMKPMLRVPVLLKMALLGIIYSAASIATYLAYQEGGTAAQLAPISQSVVVLTVLLAAIFLGERDHLVRKLIAAILVMAGVLVLR